MCLLKYKDLIKFSVRVNFSFITATISDMY